jgi:hypothetical protein
MHPSRQKMHRFLEQVGRDIVCLTRKTSGRYER